MDKPNYKSIGYARVSTSGQTTEGQVVDLKKEGCCVVFQETISTTVKEKERPQLMAALVHSMKVMSWWSQRWTV